MTIVYHLGHMYNLNSEIASAELTEGSGWSCYKSNRPLVLSALNSVSLGSKNPQVQNIWWAEWAVSVFLVRSTLSISLPGFNSTIWGAQ